MTIKLIRKVRKTGESLAITILPQIAQLHDIKEGDYVEFAAIGRVVQDKKSVKGKDYEIVIPNISSIQSMILFSSVWCRSGMLTSRVPQSLSKWFTSLTLTLMA